jgi:hypothetical protein
MGGGCPGHHWLRVCCARLGHLFLLIACQEQLPESFGEMITGSLHLLES